MVAGSGRGQVEAYCHRPVPGTKNPSLVDLRQLGSVRFAGVRLRLPLPNQPSPIVYSSVPTLMDLGLINENDQSCTSSCVNIL